MADLTGITIAQYKILRKIAGGSMGAVYKAEDLRLKRLVVIKFLKPEMVLDQRAKERFIREAQSASSIDHPNICTIYEFSQTTDGKFYMVMPYYSGEPLSRILERGPLDANKVIDIAIQLSDALASTHAKNIIHRDIKPANIFITDDGMVKLLDFGIAKLTGNGPETTVQNLSGTVSYMSPEQISGETVDNRTDLWSLGVLIYEMLTGKRPFTGEYTQTITYGILNDDPVSVLTYRKDIPNEFDSLIRKLLAKQVRNRYQLALDVSTDLKKLRSPREEPAPLSDNIKPESIIKKHPFVFIPATIIIILWLLYYYLANLQNNGSPEQIITVLPLQNQVLQQQENSLIDGFVENLIDQLATFPQFRVRPWEFSLSFKNTKADISEIYGDIGGSIFINGFYRFANDSLYINLEMTDAEQKTNLWLGAFTGTTSDIILLQNKAVQEITSVLLPESDRNFEFENLPVLSPRSMAYNYYVKARGFYYLYTYSDNENAIQLYKKAKELDSTYADAEAGLADAYAQKVLRFGMETSWLDSALAQSNLAIRHNPRLAEAYKAKALVYFSRSRFGESIALNEKALEMNRSHAPAMANLGWAYLQTGNLPKAMKNLQAAYRLYPTNPAILTGIGFVYLILGADSDAENWLKHAYTLQPDYQPNPGLLIMLQTMINGLDTTNTDLFSGITDPAYIIQMGDIYFKRGNLSDAAINYLRVMDINPQSWHPFTGINISTSTGAILKRMGEDDYQTLFELSRQQNRVAQEQGSEWWGIDYDMAAVSCASGNMQTAIQFLSSAVEKGFRFHRYLEADPHFAPMRESDGFIQLIQQLQMINKSYNEELSPYLQN